MFRKTKQEKASNRFKIKWNSFSFVVSLPRLSEGDLMDNIASTRKIILLERKKYIDEFQLLNKYFVRSLAWVSSDVTL